MAHSVGVTITNWQWTGTNVPTPQATVDIELRWKDNANVDHSWTGTATFPNDLQLVPVVWVKDKLEELIIEGVRKRLGIDA